MKIKSGKILLGLLVVALCSAVVMQFRQIEYARRLPKGVNLHGIMAQACQPWRTRELPIGPSEFIVERSEKILNYTEAWFAEVDGPTAKFDVFVSYWAPDTYEERLVGGHTPDACWPANGWKILKAENEIWLPKEVHTGIGPWEFRTFSVDGLEITRNVIFTHIADGAFTVYPLRRKSFVDSLCIGFSRRLRNRPEQLFVRVSWEGAAPYQDPAFVAIMSSLERSFWNNI